MTTETEKKEAPKAKEITFKCKFCEGFKPLSEMTVLTKFFPPVIACQDCEKKLY
ncbi:hypothetical protein ACFLWI_05770 [Chloroflexota bacterium]